MVTVHPWAIASCPHLNTPMAIEAALCARTVFAAHAAVLLTAQPLVRTAEVD